MDNLELYTKIQELVKNEARQQATQVFNELGTKYGVAQVPTHTHNGVDSLQLNTQTFIQGNKYVSGLIEDTTETVEIGGISNPTRIVFQGFVANNATTAYTLTGTVAMGATSATLDSNWTLPSDIRLVTFSNGDTRMVTFTNASTSISWTGGLSSGATASITVGASKRAIINGEINFGTSFEFSDLTPPYVVKTSGAGQPFTQSSNSMYVDSNTLANNSVSASAGAGASATAFFIIAQNESGTIIASAQATSYNNQLGILTIDFVVATGWKLQGALTIT